MNQEELIRFWPVLLSIAVLVVAASAVYSWMNKRPTLADLERRRRDMVNSIGKMGDGTITEVQPPLISFTYHVRGIEYLASQDITGMEASLPPEQWDIIGPVSIKYDPRNPANSIIVSERWSGLRRTSLRA